MIQKFFGDPFNGSIFFKLKLLFGVFLTILTILSTIVIISTELSIKRDFFSRVHFFISNAPEAIEKEDLLKKCDSLDVVAVTDNKKIAEKIGSASEIIEIPNPNSPLLNIFVIASFPRDSIIVETYGEKILLIDDKSHALLYTSALTFVVILYLLLFFLYRAIKKSLTPLRDLSIAIKRFGDGDMQIDTSSDKSDEIGEISNQFNSAVKKIRELTQAKEAFLTGAAHELKTPLAKAMIAAHLLDESKQKNTLLEIFDYQKNLIDDMLTLNGFELITKNENIEEIELGVFADELRRGFHLSESKTIEIVADSTTVKTNKRLLGLIFQNLIQNGLKFSEDGKITVIIDEQNVAFCTRGAPLIEPVWKYFEPFFKENSTRNTSGTGLGLYVSKKAAEALGFCLDYENADGVNKFVVRLSGTCSNKPCHPLG